MAPELAARTAKFHRTSRLAAVLLSALAMAGCASTQPAAATKPAKPAEALNFTPSPGKAGVYVIRPYQFTGSAALMVMQMDARKVGLLANNTYIHGEIRAGDHMLEPAKYEGGTAAENDSDRAFGVGTKSAIFTAEAGRNYFFKVKGDWVGLEIEQTSEKEGEKLVRKLKPSGR